MGPMAHLHWMTAVSWSLYSRFSPTDADVMIAQNVWQSQGRQLNALSSEMKFTMDS